jgi:hypothetical protein
LQFITLNYFAFRFINEFCNYTLLYFSDETSPLCSMNSYIENLSLIQLTVKQFFGYNFGLKVF